MKKLLSLSIAVLITATAFTQDTIPATVNKNLPGKGLDTMPKVNRNKLTLNPGNLVPDTSMHLQKPDTSMSSAVHLPDTLPGSAVNKSLPNSNMDTVNKSNALKGNLPGSGDTISMQKAMATDNTQKDSAFATKAIIEDKVVMKDDKVMLIKNGDSTLLEDSIQLKSGAVVKKDASVKFKDGTTKQLKNGQYISLNPAEKEPAAANTKMDSTTVAKTVVEDKVVMKDDQVLVIKNGDSTLLQDSIKLKSGAVVMKDASVKFKDGTTTTLKNGQYIALNPAPAESKKSKRTTTKKETTKKREKK